jgi:hypothetical protein
MLDCLQDGVRERDLIFRLKFPVNVGEKCYSAVISISEGSGWITEPAYMSVGIQDIISAGMSRGAASLKKRTVI